MVQVISAQTISDERHDRGSFAEPPEHAKSNLTKVAAWIIDRNIPFLVTSIGMIVMLLWAGSFKMTAPGAEGIVLLVSNSPLMSWLFKLFGPYIGSDIIGCTEWLAAILIITGYFRPKAGIVGALITTGMFFSTSTMLITTPGTLISVPGIHGMRYMNNLGLFLFKDVISLGVSFYLISYFGKKAILSENK
jgi:reactive chlorine resistance protein C